MTRDHALKEIAQAQVEGRGANLSGANLSGANLSWANLSGADLKDATLPPTAICPESGAYTAYKQLRDGTIAVLLVPATAKRVNAYGSRKCRSSSAKVIRLETKDGKKVTGEHTSMHSGSFMYRTGRIVKCKEPFEADARIECASGIHHFITRQEAVDYDA